MRLPAAQSAGGRAGNQAAGTKDAGALPACAWLGSNRRTGMGLAIWGITFPACCADQGCFRA